MDFLTGEETANPRIGADNTETNIPSKVSLLGTLLIASQTDASANFLSNIPHLIFIALNFLMLSAATFAGAIASEVPNAKALTTTSVKSDLRFLLRIASKLITITGTSEKADAHYIHLAPASNYSIPPPVLTLSIKSSLTRIRITVKILPPTS